MIQRPPQRPPERPPKSGSAGKSSAGGGSGGKGLGGAGAPPLALDLTETYVFLGRHGRAEAVPLTDAVWDEVADLTDDEGRPTPKAAPSVAAGGLPEPEGADPHEADPHEADPHEAGPHEAGRHEAIPHGAALHGDGWYVSAFWMEADMATWERHASGERLIVAQSGAFTLVLEYPDGKREPQPLNAAGSVLVPCGCWHRLTVTTPGMVVFITPSHGMEHRLA